MPTDSGLLGAEHFSVRGTYLVKLDIWDEESPNICLLGLCLDPECMSAVVLSMQLY